MDSSRLRWEARESLKENYWMAVLVAFVASIFGSLVVGSGFNVEIDTDLISEWFGRMPRIVSLYLAVVGSFASVLSIVTLVLGGVVQLGYAQYLLKQYDNQGGDVKDLFSKFDYFKQGFLQALLRAIFVFLWSLLFIIPGIIKGLSYSMTPFIMAENPEMSARDAITASKELMNGHKADLFILGLSFIGWELLNALTMGIGSIFLNPYINAAYAAFYRNITNQNPVVERSGPIPVE